MYSLVTVESKKHGYPLSSEEPQITHDHSVWPVKLEGKGETIKQCSICRNVISILYQFDLLPYVPDAQMWTLWTMTKKIGHPVLLQPGSFLTKTQTITYIIPFCMTYLFINESFKIFI